MLRDFFKNMDLIGIKAAKLRTFQETVDTIEYGLAGLPHVTFKTCGGIVSTNLPGPVSVDHQERAVRVNPLEIEISLSPGRIKFRLDHGTPKQEFNERIGKRGAKDAVRVLEELATVRPYRTSPV